MRRDDTAKRVFIDLLAALIALAAVGVSCGHALGGGFLGIFLSRCIGGWMGAHLPLKDVWIGPAGRYQNQP